MKTITTALILVALAGCMNTGSTECAAGPATYGHEPSFSANPCAEYVAMGFDGATWPDLSGHTITILDHGAFEWAFGAAKPVFENLTGATVVHHAADDAGTALQLAAQDVAAGGGTFDILYGIDNVLMGKAMDEGIFEPYTPYFAHLVQPEYRFVPSVDGAWLATPVDMGYIGINVDPRANLTINNLDDVARNANHFVTQDPRFSSPGLGFLVATVATYGEDGYLDYWQQLFDGGVTVTSGWTEAYVDRFSGGYGQWETGTRSDKAIVNSYTTSPAYEAYYGGELNDALTEDASTFQQIQTMGIVKGTHHRAAAEAWIEFTLTPDFQELAAAYNAIYPVTGGQAIDESVEGVFAGNDPAPGTFNPAAFTAAELGNGVDDWVADWTDLYTRQ